MRRAEGHGLHPQQLYGLLRPQLGTPKHLLILPEKNWTLNVKESDALVRFCIRFTSFLISHFPLNTKVETVYPLGIRDVFT